MRNLPSRCVCGSVLSTDHAMIGSHGYLTITRHDICNITANWLSKCAETLRDNPHCCLSQVRTSWPFLQTDVMMQEQIDIRATGFWGHQQCASFDVRVFHPNAQSYHHSSISSLYHRHEQAKKREYGDRNREVENGSFAPLVFATTGGMGREATLFYKASC